MVYVKEEEKKEEKKVVFRLLYQHYFLPLPAKKAWKLYA